MTPRTRWLLLTSSCAVVLTIVAALAASTAGAAKKPPPYMDPSLPVGQRVDDLLSRMTLAEKIGQMTQTERYQVYDDATPITTYGWARFSPAAARRPRRTTRGPGPTWSIASSGPPSPRAFTSRCSTGSTPSTATATCSARPSSRTTSAWAPRATRRWCATSSTSPRRRRARPARSGPSRHASAPPGTIAGGARTRASARTRRWSSRWRPPSTASRARPASCRSRSRARDRQALRRRRRHDLRHGERRLQDRPGHRRSRATQDFWNTRCGSTRAPCRTTTSARSCRRTRAWTGPRTASAIRSRCTRTGS